MQRTDKWEKFDEAFDCFDKGFAATNKTFAAAIEAFAAAIEGFKQMATDKLAASPEPEKHLMRFTAKTARGRWRLCRRFLALAAAALFKGCAEFQFIDKNGSYEQQHERKKPDSRLERN